MLTARADTTLSGRGASVGALFQAQETVFKLVHPCVGKQQGRIVSRHQRRTFYNLVTFAFKE
ncbi:Uncharacterised protein [Vibrio cholerae]|nr:Uncharacterised protein [Vibrio cholerae]